MAQKQLVVVKDKLILRAGLKHVLDRLHGAGIFQPALAPQQVYMLLPETFGRVLDFPIMVRNRNRRLFCYVNLWGQN